LPAEIHHLLEEIEAKDKIVAECRSTINAKDSGHQKFIKANGCSMVSPKEDANARTIAERFKTAGALQNEKISLSDKACLLVSSLHEIEEAFADLKSSIGRSRNWILLFAT
jgi:inhibitor of growth protein 3